jgi:hypothetical protein
LLVIDGSRGNAVRVLPKHALLWSWGGRAGPAQNREHRPRGAAGAQTPGDEGEGWGASPGDEVIKRSPLVEPKKYTNEVTLSNRTPSFAGLGPC